MFAMLVFLQVIQCSIRMLTLVTFVFDNLMFNFFTAFQAANVNS